MATCILTGTVESPPATPLAGAIVRVRTVAPTLTASGAGVATNDLTTTTAVDGTWSLTLEQGLHAQIDIPAVGIASDITIPALTTVALSALTLYARGTLTPATIIGTSGPSMGGDLTGSSPNPSVVGLRGKALHADTASDGKLWVYRSASGDYRLESFPVLSAVSSVVAGQGITVTGTTTPTVAVTSQGITDGMMATGAAAANVGALGGDLSGTLPNAQIGTGVIVNADVNASAAIDWTKISKSGAAASDVGAVASGTVLAAINASAETPKIAAAQLAGGIAESQVTGLVSDLAAKRNTADAIAQADVTGLVAGLAAKEATANKGAVSGYAGLDGTGKVPAAQLPATVLADGDKGDITVSGSGATFTIDAAAVTFAKMQSVATDTLVGRATAGTGAPESIALTAQGRALLDDATASDQRTTLGLGTSAVLNVPVSGDAGSGEVVKGSDTRLADARTPTAHTHAEADVTGLTSALAAKVPTSRTVGTTAPLTGGGALTGNLTLGVDGATGAAAGIVQLAGDLGGTSASPSVASVGGQTAANVAAGSVLANAATATNTPGTIVKRDGSGAVAVNVTGALTGNASGTAANVTGVVAIANGGTGQATATAGFDALAPTSAKGDLIGHNGADNVRIPVGADGLALVADTASAAGVKWATPASGSVTSVATGNGLQGGPITTTGTVDLKLLAAGGLSKTLGTGSELGIAAGGVADAMLATAVVPQARTITTTAPLTGGGALTGNLTLAVSDAAAGSKGVVQLAGDISGTAAAPTVATVGGQTAANVAAGAVLANAAVSAKTNNAIVRRDGSGAAALDVVGNVTGNLTGNVTGNVTGNLIGDMTGVQRDMGGAIFDVKAYGATGDGSTDDTAALGDVITAMGATGGVMYFPPGNYKFSTLTISVNGTVLRGAGSGSTTLSTTTVGGTGLTLSGDSTGLEGVTFDVIGSAVTPQISVLASGANVGIRDVRFVDCFRGLSVTGDGGRIEDVAVNSVASGAEYAVNIDASNVIAERIAIGETAGEPVIYGVKVAGSNNILRNLFVSTNGNATALYLAGAINFTASDSTLYGAGTGVAVDAVGVAYGVISRAVMAAGYNAVRTAGVNTAGLYLDACRVGEGGVSRDTILHGASGAVVLTDCDVTGGGATYANVHITGASSAFSWYSGTLKIGNPFAAGAYGVLADGGAAKPVLYNVAVESASFYTTAPFAGGVLVGANVASGASIAITSAVTHVTGTTPIDTISAPFSSGPIVLIPDGAWSFTTAGNIAVALTASVGVPITLVYDDVTAKWYPSVSVAPITTSGTTTNTNGALFAQRNVEAVTTTKSPTAAESREVYTNEGDADGAAVTLPTAAAGLEFTFYVQTAQLLTINAAAGDTIRLGANVTAAAGYVRSNLVGSRVTLLAINATEWVGMSFSGEWTNGTWWAYDTHAEGGIYFATPAATANTTNTPIKCAGTTAAQGTPKSVTQATTNRLTYTGAPTRNFKVTATIGISAAATATTSKLHIYKNGSLVTGLTVTRYIAGSDIGAVAIHGIVSLAPTDYIELWCETDDGDDLTIKDGVLSLTSID